MCWGGVAPARLEMCCVIVLGVWWNVIDDLVFCFGDVEAVVLGHCWWTSGGQSKFPAVPEEQDVVAVGVSWPLPPVHWVH